MNRMVLTAGGAAPRASPEAELTHANPPLMMSLLSPILGVLGSRRKARAVRDALGLRRLAQRWLHAAVVEPQRAHPDNVTVLIGIRNRTDHRLELALRSIREQQYPAALVNALVVDYGSEPAAADRAEAVCREYGASHVRVQTQRVWSRSRCLNVGIRRAQTKFLLTSDVDILFSPTYIAQAVNVLREFPLSVVCAPMLDLPEAMAEVLRLTSENTGALQLHEWKQSSTPRFDDAYHPSIAMTYTTLHQYIRGYDEFYELWGSEDVDLFHRLIRLGLDRQVLTHKDAFYLHQWHPKYENIPADARQQAVRRNVARWRSAKTLVRNDASWGSCY